MPVERTIELRALVKRLTEAFPFWHGGAGLCVNYDHGEMDPDRNDAIRAALERYAGLDGHDLITESRGLLTTVKGAQWQTWIHRDLLRRGPLVRETVERLAGRGALSFSTSDGGLRVQAGPMPLLGDRHRDEPLVAYRYANVALEPLMVDNLFPLPGFPDEAAAREWLHRLRSAERA